MDTNPHFNPGSLDLWFPWSYLRKLFTVPHQHTCRHCRTSQGTHVDSHIIYYASYGHRSRPDSSAPLPGLSKHLLEHRLVVRHKRRNPDQSPAESARASHIAAEQYEMKLQELLHCCTAGRNRGSRVRRT
eukprot:816648-Rhodomonas_salina.2